MDAGTLAEHYAGLGLSGADAMHAAESGIDPRNLFTDEESPFVEAECGHECVPEEIGSDGKCVNCTIDK